MSTSRVRRRDRVRYLVAAAGLDALLVTHLPDVLWLSGFSGSHGAVLVGRDEVVLATDGRYAQQIAVQSPDTRVVISRRPVVDLVLDAADRGARRIAIQPRQLSVGDFGAVTAGVPTVKLVLEGPSLSPLRSVKDDEEVAAIRRACRISTAALGQTVEAVRPGMTEIEVARLLELMMGRLGAQDRSFDTIVATGPHSAIPHHAPTTRPLAVGDLLKIDFGAVFDDYHADCTRTFVVAADPEPWQREVHDVVRAAQRAGLDALAPGRVGGDIDEAARAVITAAGFGDRFPHGLGHGVGLEIHEAPYLGPDSPNTVEASVVLTVEPGVYLPGRGGVRIEDTVLVTGGGIEILTEYPRALARVG